MVWLRRRNSKKGLAIKNDNGAGCNPKKIPKLDLKLLSNFCESGNIRSAAHKNL